MTYIFDTPLGNADLLVSSYTSCGHTDACMYEDNGGQNLLTLSGGTYNFARRIDFGKHGELSVEFAIRPVPGGLHGDGRVVGDVRVPKLLAALPIKSTYIPRGAGRLSAYSVLRYVTDEGDVIPGEVFSEYDYHELNPCVGTQLRTSSVEFRRINAYQLHMDWHTIIEPINALSAVESSFRTRLERHDNESGPNAPLFPTQSSVPFDS